jgi:hypothetical protein
MISKNITLKEMLSVLRDKGIGITKVEELREGVYMLYFANGFMGTFSEHDHVHRAIRSSSLNKKNKVAKELINKATEYVPYTLIKF